MQSLPDEKFSPHGVHEPFSLAERLKQLADIDNVCGHGCPSPLTASVSLPVPPANAPRVFLVPRI